MLLVSAVEFTLRRTEPEGEKFMWKMVVFFLAICVLSCCTGCSSIFAVKKKPYPTPIEYGYLYNYYDLWHLHGTIFPYISYSNFVNNSIKAIEYEDYGLETAGDTGEVHRRFYLTTKVEFDQNHVPTAFLENTTIGVTKWELQQYYKDIIDTDGFLIEREWYNAKDSSPAFRVVYSYNSDGQISKIRYKDRPNRIALYFSYDDSLRMTEMEVHEGITREYYKINELGVWYEQYIAKTDWLGLCTSEPILRIRKEYKEGQLHSSIHYYRSTEYDGVFAIAGADRKYLYKYNEKGLMVKILNGGKIHPDYLQGRKTNEGILATIEYNSKGLPVKIISMNAYGNPYHEILLRYEYYE